jgi:hypothetical protein
MSRYRKLKQSQQKSVSYHLPQMGLVKFQEELAGFAMSPHEYGCDKPLHGSYSMAGWYLFLSTQYEKVQSKQGYEREEI